MSTETIGRQWERQNANQERARVSGSWPRGLNIPCMRARFYAATMGRPSLAPGRYFRLLLIGYFEGLDSERAIAWRAADSFALRRFLHMELVEAPPDHSTISRTRRLIDLETDREVFTWILKQLAEAGLVNGKTIGIDATTLEANAALRSIVRRDSGESYPGVSHKARAGLGDRDAHS